VIVTFTKSTQTLSHGNGKPFGHRLPLSSAITVISLANCFPYLRYFGG